jgi:chromosome segregation ATPase
VRQMQFSLEMTPDYVLHIGAGSGSDVADYMDANMDPIILVDADPEMIEELQVLTKDMAPVRVIEAAVSEEAGDALFYQSNFTDLSGLLPPSEALGLSFPGAQVLRQLRVSCQSPVSLINALNVPKTRAGILVIEAPGVALRILKALAGSEAITGFQAVRIQDAKEPLYEGAPTLSQIRAQLEDLGYLTFLEAVPEDPERPYIIGVINRAKTAQFDSLLEQNRNLRGHFASFKEACEAANVEATDLRKALETQKQQSANELEEARNQAELEVSKLAAELETQKQQSANELEEARNQAELEVSKLAAELETQKQQSANELEEARNQAELEVSKLAAELETQKQQSANELEEARNQAELEVSKLAAELETQKQQSANELEEARNQAELEVSKLAAELESQKQQSANELEEARNQAELEVSKLAAENQRLEGEHQAALLELQSTCTALETQKQQGEEALKAEKSSLQKCEASLSQTQEALQECEQSLDALSHRSEVARQDLNRIEGQITLLSDLLLREGGL